MTRLLSWLREHRMVHITAIIIYYVLVVAPHKVFGKFINQTIAGSFGLKISTEAGRYQYNLAVFLMALVILIGLTFFLVKNLKTHPEKKKLSLFFIVNVILALLTIRMLFVISIEVIHFPQYAMFAILIFPLIGSYTATLIWATLGGMLDEAYQYFYLAPLDTSYYDLNDVVTNLIGAVFGLLILAVLQVKEYSRFQLKNSSIWIGLGLVMIAVTVAHLSGILSIYPSDDRPYHILRTWPPGFWSTVNPNVTFHVIRPIEGVVITFLLWIFYSNITPRKVAE